MSTLAERICRHLHPAEWDSPTPRTAPCADCVTTSAAVAVNGPLIHINPAPPPPSTVVVVCASCGGRAQGRMRA